MVHASRGRLAPAEPAAAVRAGHRLPAGARASSGADSRTPWEEFEKDYAHDPRPHRPRRARASRTSTRASPAPAASPCRTPRATSAASPPPPARPTSPPRPSSTPSSPRAGCCCRPCAPTTSTTPRSTASTTATAASRTAAGSCWSTPRTPASWASPTASYTDLVSEWTDGVERRAPGFRVVALPDGPRLRRRLLPGDQRAGPAGRHRGHQQHPGQQVRRRSAGTRMPAGNTALSVRSGA